MEYQTNCHFIFLSGQGKSKKVPQLNWKQNLLPALTLYDMLQYEFIDKKFKFSLLISIQTVSHRKIVPWGDMCLLVMNYSLYSSNHKIDKKKKKKRIYEICWRKYGRCGVWNPVPFFPPDLWTYTDIKPVSTICWENLFLNECVFLKVVFIVNSYNIFSS